MLVHSKEHNQQLERFKADLPIVHKQSNSVPDLANQAVLHKNADLRMLNAMHVARKAILPQHVGQNPRQDPSIMVHR